MPSSFWAAVLLSTSAMIGACSTLSANSTCSKMDLRYLPWYPDTRRRRLTKGKRITCYEHVRFEAEQAGGTFVDQQAVRDGRIVTGQTWQSHPEFLSGDFFSCLASHRPVLKSRRSSNRRSVATTPSRLHRSCSRPQDCLCLRTLRSKLTSGAAYQVESLIEADGRSQSTEASVR